MGLLYYEDYTPDFYVCYRVKDVIYTGRSQYQNIEVIDTDTFGKILFLDNAVMVTERDEFYYHEMIVHPAMVSHPNPKRVLVVGGGDGGTVREVMKYDVVEEVVLAELDEEVVKVSKEYLPSISCALDDPRLKIEYGDASQFVKKHTDKFDVIIVDSTDPIGPGEILSGEEFIRDCFNLLNAPGIYVAQTQSYFFGKEFLRKYRQKMMNVFGNVYNYFAPVPTYPGGGWSFTMGTKGVDPTKSVRPAPSGLKYYVSQMQANLFIVPPFLLE